MRPALAGRLSRALVGWHPRRWRERYGEEMLEVLDQHHPTARTVASLGASAISAGLDPAWRTGRLSLPRLRRAAVISAVVAAPLALVLGPVGYAMWQSDHWQPGAGEPLETAAFSPHTGIMVTAFGGAIDGTDMVWDVTDLGRPRRLSQFEGGQPTALSPDGRTVATVTFHDQTILWNVTDPRHPARTATVRGLLDRARYPDGQTQPDEVLCSGCILASYAEAFAFGGHTLTVVVDREEMSANSGRDTVFDWPVTGSGILGAAAVSMRDVADSQPFIAPSDRTVLGGSPVSHAWRAWALL
jgi:hypothetical protein